MSKRYPSDKVEPQRSHPKTKPIPSVPRMEVNHPRVRKVKTYTKGR